MNPELVIKPGIGASFWRTICGGVSWASQIAALGGVLVKLRHSQNWDEYARIRNDWLLPQRQDDYSQHSSDGFL